jgi:hypothetical protein
MTKSKVNGWQIHSIGRVPWQGQRKKKELWTDCIFHYILHTRGMRAIQENPLCSYFHLVQETNIQNKFLKIQVLWEIAIYYEKSVLLFQAHVRQFQCIGSEVGDGSLLKTGLLSVGSE